MSGIDLKGETEESLVAALQQGRQEVLGLLYDAYAPVIMGVVMRIVPDKEVAEQVLQETFMAIWSRIDVYNPARNRFLIWGLVIARGIALEAVKNGKGNLVVKEQRSANFAGAADAKELVSYIREQEDKQFCQLEPQERAVLELVYLKGHSCSEDAAALGITEEVLKAKLRSAFIHLKSEKSA